MPDRDRAVRGGRLFFRRAVGSCAAMSVAVTAPAMTRHIPWMVSLGGAGECRMENEIARTDFSFPIENRAIALTCAR